MAHTATSGIARHIIAATVLTVGALTPTALGQGRTDRKIDDRLKVFQSHGYIIHTDLPVASMREVAAGLGVMRREYQRQIGGSVDRRMHFFLFSRAEDYHAYGGPQGSAGVYNRKGLLAVAQRHGGVDWHVIKHEAFHQYEHQVLGGRLPVWMNEGLADYYGQAQWAGDQIVTGIVRPRRMMTVQAAIEAKTLKPFGKMMAITRNQWNSNLDSMNYLQTWSMVHFLIHADNGKYGRPFNRTLNAIINGAKPDKAFRRHFNVVAFEKRYRTWWTQLDRKAAAVASHKATATTLTSFLARAHLLKLKIADFDDFLTSADDGRMKQLMLGTLARQPELFLPPELFESAAAEARRLADWRLQLPKGRGVPELELRTPDGTVYSGKITIKGGKLRDLVVVVSRRPAQTAGETRPSGKEDPDVLTPAERAKQLRAKAEQAEKRGDLKHAAELYRQYVRSFSRVDGHQDVSGRLKGIEQRLAMQSGRDAREVDETCRRWLNLADSYISTRNNDKARIYLRRILRDYPQTRWARDARRRLEAITPVNKSDSKDLTP